MIMLRVQEFFSAIWSEQWYWDLLHRWKRCCSQKGESCLIGEASVFVV